MIDVILLLVVLGQSALIGWLDYNNRKERKSLTNALLSKTNQELVNLELADKTKIETPKENTEPKSEDLVEVKSMGDDEFLRFIGGKE